VEQIEKHVVIVYCGQFNCFLIFEGAMVLARRDHGINTRLLPLLIKISSEFFCSLVKFIDFKMIFVHHCLYLFDCSLLFSEIVEQPANNSFKPIWFACDKHVFAVKV